MPEAKPAREREPQIAFPRRDRNKPRGVFFSASARLNVAVNSLVNSIFAERLIRPLRFFPIFASRLKSSADFKRFDGDFLFPQNEMNRVIGNW
jgi:hypothetical protein